jgi:hypothetical protein
VVKARLFVVMPTVIATTVAMLTAAPLQAQSAPQARADQNAPPPSADAPRELRRNDIKMMETLLTNAVRNGASTVASRLQVQEPGTLFVTETARTRGFSLDSYGVFFDVDVPDLKPSMLYVMRELYDRDTRNKIAQLQQLRLGTTDPTEARQLDAQLHALGAHSDASGNTPVAEHPPAAGTATAQSVDTAAPPMTPLDPNSVNALYTDSVKSALIDAMLKYNFTPRIGDEEWLTVAAREASGPPLPGQLDEASTIVIRIKGSDLADYQAGRITREDILKRVKVSEF